MSAGTERRKGEPRRIPHATLRKVALDELMRPFDEKQLNQLIAIMQGLAPAVFLEALHQLDERDKPR